MSEDAIRARLSDAKATYKRSITDAKRTLINAVDARALAVAATGDVASAQAFKAFSKSVADDSPSEPEVKDLAILAARRSHDRSVAAARAAVIAAYRAAVADHARGMQLEAATDVQRELDDLGICMPSDAVGFGGHLYKAYEGPLTWDAADRKCRAMGGHLAYVETRAEQDFVWKLASQGNCWLGATRKGDRGEWRWGNGQRLSFTYWAAGQPDNAMGRQSAMYIWTNDGHWDDFEPTAAFAFVCEWENVPR